MVRFLTIALIVSVVVVGCVRPDSVMSSRVSQFIPIDSIVIDHSDLGLVLWGPRLIEREGSHRFCLVDDNNIYTDYDLQTGKRLTSIDLKPWLRKAGADDAAAVSATVWLRSSVLAIFCRELIGVVIVDLNRGRVSSHSLRPYSDSSGTYVPFVSPTACEPMVIQRDSGVVRMMVGLQRMFGNSVDEELRRRLRFAHAPYTVFSVGNDLKIASIGDIGAYPKNYHSEVVMHARTSLFCTDTSAIISFDTDSNVTEYRLSDGVLIRSMVVPTEEKIVNVPYDLENDDPRYFAEYYYTTTRAPWVKKVGRQIVRAVVPGNALPTDRIVPREHNEHDWKIFVVGDEPHSTAVIELSGLEYHSNFFETLGNFIYLLHHSSGEDRFTIVRGRIG